MKYAIDKEKLATIRDHYRSANSTNFGLVSALISCLVPLEEGSVLPEEGKVSEAGFFMQAGKRYQVSEVKTPPEDHGDFCSCQCDCQDCSINECKCSKSTEQVEVCGQCGSDEVDKDEFGHWDCANCGRIDKPAPAEEPSSGGPTVKGGPKLPGRAPASGPSDFWERFDKKFNTPGITGYKNDWTLMPDETKNWLKRELKKEVNGLRMKQKPKSTFVTDYDVGYFAAVEKSNAKLDAVIEGLGL